MKKIITYILAAISLASIFIATGIKEIPNWWEIAKPFFIIWFIATALTLIICNINYIRRITYPVLVCISAYLYKNKICMTKFTQSTYRVYKMQNKSYKKLFSYVQNLFDVYIEGLENGL